MSASNKSESIKFFFIDLYVFKEFVMDIKGIRSSCIPGFKWDNPIEQSCSLKFKYMILKELIIKLIYDNIYLKVILT